MVVVRDQHVFCKVHVLIDGGGRVRQVRPSQDTPNGGSARCRDPTARRKASVALALSTSATPRTRTGLAAGVDVSPGDEIGDPTMSGVARHRCFGGVLHAHLGDITKVRVVRGVGRR